MLHAYNWRGAFFRKYSRGHSASVPGRIGGFSKRASRVSSYPESPVAVSPHLRPPYSLGLRIERRIRMQLRRLQHEETVRPFVRTVQRYEREGRPLARALHQIATDVAINRNPRATSARLLAVSKCQNHSALTEHLLSQFFSQELKGELWETAWILERLGDIRAVGPLIHALQDVNHDRRHAAARALGWIRNPSNRAVRALIHILTDASQPVPVREAAAESLAYLASSRAVPVLISVLRDSDVRIRFWAVFALGIIRKRYIYRNFGPRRGPVAGSNAHRPGDPPGNWWSVAREALAMLGQLNPPEASHRDRFIHELQRVTGDPNASPEDRQWVGFFKHSMPTTAIP
jgi:HEAT repeat protein